MFYILNIGADCTFDELKRSMESHLANMSSNEAVDVLRNTPEEFVISFDWATLSIQEGGQGLRFKSEDYDMELRYSFWFDILPQSGEWAEQFMSLTGYILNQFQGDCVLESNGDTPILTRRNHLIVVDDKQLKGTVGFPFHALNLDYKEGDIEKV